MARTTRRTPTFDAMEGKVLLSTGLAHKSAVAEVARAEVTLSPVKLTGTLKGIPFGTVGPDGIDVSSFTLKGKTPTMGRVAASLAMPDPYISPGKEPNLSNATLTLANARGSVQIKMAASPSNRYVYIVTGGGGTYASAYGSGTAVISYNGRMHEYQVVLHSATR